MIGALNLFRTSPGAMPAVDVRLAQAMPDVASIAIPQDKAVRELQIRAGDLQHALDSRVAIEQAKGMVAERAKVDTDEAFRRLRTHARSHNRRLTGLAVDVVSGAVALDTVYAAGAPEPHRRP